MKAVHHMTSLPKADPRRVPADSATTADAARAAESGSFRRVRVAAASIGAAVLGAAPHVLHHAGLLAGAAIFAGLGGKLIFAAVGLLAAIPLLLKMRRRSGAWRRPAAALALFGALFALSSFVIAPALTGASDEDDRFEPSSAPSGMDSNQHNQHHP